MIRKKLTTIAASVCVVLGAFIEPNPAWSGDFPGLGDRSAWSDALPYYNRGNRYLTQERFADAAKDYQEAIAKYPQDPDFFINLGIALRKLEDYVGAEQAFKSATRLNPKDWVAWNNLGAAYLKQDRMKDTIAAFEHALKCNPPTADKTALLRDLADIHKLLRATGQEPMPGAPKQTNAKKKARTAVVSKPSSSAALRPTLAPVPAVTNRPAAPAKDWGYE